MKKTNLALAVILSLNFSVPAYSNPSEMIEAETQKKLTQAEDILKRTLLGVTLKLKAQELQKLLKTQWIIENMHSNNVEAFYINQHDNPYLISAATVLVNEGLILRQQINNYRLYNSNKLGIKGIANLMKEELLLAIKNPEIILLYRLVVVGVSGLVIYSIVDTTSNTAKFRDSLSKYTRDEISKIYANNQIKIEQLSKEITDLKK